MKDNPSLQADMVVSGNRSHTRHSISKRSRFWKLGIKESIVVNDRMETSVPDTLCLQVMQFR